MTGKRAVLIEWPTLVVLAATYAAWGGAVFWLSEWSLTAAVLLAGVTVAQQASLQHEALHGHPTAWQWLNALMVRPSLNLFIPYGRFRDTHLAHHRDANLTDPYDDPETNFLTQKDWEGQPGWHKAILKLNNTLAGRMLIGPFLGQWAFLRADMREGGTKIARSWAAHLVGAAGVLWLVFQSPMPVWAYLVAAYLGVSLLKIRTFLEHRAHEQCRARSVIIEDRGPLALLFLNNNLHAVHHMHPQVSWYDLPHTYRAQRDRFLACNDRYLYPSYATVFMRHLLWSKDPVAHPLLRREQEKLDA